MSNIYFEKAVELFKGFAEVDAITLGGSRATGRYDAGSDYDTYIYLNRDLCTEKRRNALNQVCKYMEIDNRYFEPEDDCVLSDGTGFEIIYRNIDDIRESLTNTLVNHIAWGGYTTCICFNVFTSKILYDPHGSYEKMVVDFTMPYPEELRRNIITKNRELLEGKIPSFFGQIEQAINRNDINSINHRTTEFLACYFDILFALNREFHPGEKRLLEYGAGLKLVPADFTSDLTELLTVNDKEEMPAVMRRIVDNIDALIAEFA